MNPCFTRLSLALTVLLAIEPASAAVRYVDVNNPNPVSPYLNWAGAATNIQDAIDAANPGDRVLVTNGVYRTGATAIAPYLSRSRVALTKAVVVQSVNGPAVTLIEGERTPSGGRATYTIRCAYLTNGAVLAGFTLTNGAPRNTGEEHDQNGGAAWCESTSAVVSNCVLVNCRAYAAGGAHGGTLKNCLLTNNYADFGGGGAYTSVLSHCSLVWNTSGYYGGGTYLCDATNCLFINNLAPFGGGATAGTLRQCTLYWNAAAYGGGAHGIFYSLTLHNCIVYFNSSTQGGDNSAGDIFFTNCCTTPLPPGPGNISSDPLLLDQGYLSAHLQTNSPCINAGNNKYAASTRDLDGRPRIVSGTVDMGAFEFQGPDLGRFVPWLHQYGLPNDGSADVVDSDGDGLNNWEEWRADTIPTNPLSALRMVSVTPGVVGRTVRWESVNTRRYSLERRASLAPSSPFLRIATNIAGQAGTTFYTDTNTGRAPFFYRVGTQE